MIKTNGATLIEIAIFIALLGILGTGLFTGFITAQSNESKSINNTIATDLAQERMEIILGNKKTAGFGSFADICASNPAEALCPDPPTGYTVGSTITSNYLGNANLKLITVTVTGNGNETLNLMVSNY